MLRNRSRYDGDGSELLLRVENSMLHFEIGMLYTHFCCGLLLACCCNDAALLDDERTLHFLYRDLHSGRGIKALCVGASFVCTMKEAGLLCPLKGQRASWESFGDQKMNICFFFC